MVGKAVFISVAVLVGLTMGMPVTVADPAAPAPAVTPQPQQWNPRPGTFAPTAGARVVVGSAAVGDDAATFASDVRSLTGLALPLTSGPPRPGDIVLSTAALGMPAEGYTLDIDDTVRITGQDATGLFHGVQTVEQMVQAGGAGGARTLPRGTMRDWPVLSDRGIMLDLARHYETVPYIKRQIRLAAWHKFSEVHLHLSDTEGYRLPSRAYPNLSAQQHYSFADIADIAVYAQRYHIRLLPEFDVPSHSTALIAWDPTLGWNCGGGALLNITSDHVTQVVTTLIDEVMRLFPNSPVIHLGGDEYPSISDQAACTGLTAYAHAHHYASTEDVFVAWQNALAAHLKAAGRTMEIWNWWDVVGTGGTITPDTSVIVEPWYSKPVTDYPGWKVVSAPDNYTRDFFLYITPNEMSGADSEEVALAGRLYDSWRPATGAANLLGYESPLWGSDDPSTRQYEEWFADRPWPVIADRTWGGNKLADSFAFEDLLDRIGNPPEVSDPNPTRFIALHGTPYGDAGTSGHQPAAAFDGDTGSYYQSAGTGNAGIGIDLGPDHASRVTEIRYVPVDDPDPNWPASYQPGGMDNTLNTIGGQFQGCTSGPDTGCVTLATITWRSAYDWHRLPVSDSHAYRWLRYLGASGKDVKVSEIQFDTTPPGDQSITIDPPNAGDASAQATLTFRNDGDQSLQNIVLSLTETTISDREPLPTAPAFTIPRVAPHSTITRTIPLGATTTSAVWFNATATYLLDGVPHTAQDLR
ncbi:family 20 glycosylhydrolase [Nocardia sp. NPDC051570]|uniref:family 20 glycosylhydrolase n=1 Tax=Nocardia sp. NPDC051570 TaxID=3364324 RepID=UPI00378CDADB